MPEDATELAELFGDHTGLVLEPLVAEVEQADDGQLSFHRAKRIDPGHEA